jgi:hypothetical protein
MVGSEKMKSFPNLPLRQLQATSGRAASPNIRSTRGEVLTAIEQC